MEKALAYLRSTACNNNSSGTRSHVRNKNKKCALFELVICEELVKTTGSIVNLSVGSLLTMKYILYRFGIVISHDMFLDIVSMRLILKGY